MTKKQIKKKYQEQINAIAEAQGMDVHHALDMLIMGARNHGVPNTPRYIDNIDVDIIALLRDVKEYDEGLK